MTAPCNPSTPTRDDTAEALHGVLCGCNRNDPAAPHHYPAIFYCSYAEAADTMLAMLLPSPEVWTSGEMFVIANGTAPTNSIAFDDPVEMLVKATRSVDARLDILRSWPEQNPPVSPLHLHLDYRAAGRVADDCRGLLRHLLAAAPPVNVHILITNPRDRRPSLADHHVARMLEVFDGLRNGEELPDDVPAAMADIAREVMLVGRRSAPDHQRVLSLLRERADRGWA